MIDLKHWRTIEKISVEHAGLLVAGVDPFDQKSASSALLARGRTFEMAICQASELAFTYAHGVVHQLYKNPIDPAHFNIWERSGSFDRYLPSIELRECVAEVLKDPDNVPLLTPVDPWFSETVHGSELRRWMLANDIHSAYNFPDNQAVVIRDRGLTTWAEWYADRDEANTWNTKQPEGRAPWPWGSYETMLLRKLAAAAERFWINYDPEDATTAPTNAQVITWLKAQGVAERTAEVMATILRVDGLPTGPRK